jgi:hypothetical protein
MVEFSSSPEARALARLKELHRAEEAPHDFRVLVAERLGRLEAPASNGVLWKRGGFGLLLLAAAAALVLALRSEHTRIILLPEQPAAPHTTAAPGHSVDVKAGSIAVSGRLAPAVIRGVMRHEFGRFRECYEMLPPPRPVVMATLNFTIGTKGSVTAAHVDSEASPVLGQCLERVILALHFPAPEAGDVTVAYPMQFAP